MRECWFFFPFSFFSSFFSVVVVVWGWFGFGFSFSFRKTRLMKMNTLKYRYSIDVKYYTFFRGARIF